MKDNTLGRVVRAGLVGTFLGGVVGFATGLLLAPEKGSRLRRRISFRLESVSKQVSDLADEILTPETEGEAQRTRKAFEEDVRLRAERIGSDIDALLGEMKEKEVKHSSTTID